MKILMINHSLAMGGSPISLLELAATLKERHGFEIEVASEKSGSIYNNFMSIGIKVHILPRRGIASLGTVVDYFHVIKRNNFEAVHLNTCTSYFKYPAIAAKILRISVFWWCREDTNTKRVKRLLSWIERLATCVVTVSREQLSGIAPITKRMCTHVLYKGIPPGKSLIHEPSTNEPVDIFPDSINTKIGYIGSIEERKGLIDLIQALPNLSINYECYIIGTIPRDSEYLSLILEYVKKHNLDKYIHFLGEQKNARDFLKYFDVFVFPTHWDCCARVLIEAMAAKCPIVTTNIGGTPEILRDKIDAILVPIKAPIKIAVAIEETISNPDRTIARTESAFNYFKNNLTMNNHADEVALFYEKTIQNSA